MFFTKNDFDKIAEYLKAHSMKDTDFSKKESVSASSDILTIVSNGNNYKINISNLLKSGIPLVTINKLTAIAIEALDMEATKSLIVDASKILLNNTKGTTLLDVLDYFEANKVDKRTDNIINGNLTINKNLSVNLNSTLNGHTEVTTGGLNVTGTTTITGNLNVDGEIKLENNIISSSKDKITVCTSLKTTGDITDGNNNVLSDVNAAAKGYKILLVTPTSDLVKDEYKLLDYQNNLKGPSIKIYKDSAIQNVYLGTMGDSINPITGEITHGIGDTALCILYIKIDGKYELVKVNVEEFLTEAEFGDGLKVVGHHVSIKLSKDNESSTYLHFDEEGALTINGIKNYIDAQLGTKDESTKGDGTIWGTYKLHEGTLEDSLSGDGSRWGEFKTAEIFRDLKVSDEIDRIQAKVDEVNLETIKNALNNALQAIVDRETEILTKTDASLISASTSGLSGNNVLDNLNNAGQKLSDLSQEVSELELKTGQQFSQLEQEVSNLDSDLNELKGGDILIPVDIGTNIDNIGYYNMYNGSLTNNSSYRYYPPVDLSEYVGKSLKMEVQWGTAPSSSYNNAICIFTASGTPSVMDGTPKGYVGEYDLYMTKVGSKATLITTIEKPYLRISTHKDSNCIITVNVVDTTPGMIPILEEKVTALETKKVAPIGIKNAPFLEEFRFCTIYPNKVVNSTTSIDGKNYIVWDNSYTNWYTIAINIKTYKDLVLVSDILPQSVISKFLTIGVDVGGENIEYVATTNSDTNFIHSPTAYVFDESQMTITLSTLFSTYYFRGNIILYIKMPSTYKINWSVSGMQLEGYDWMKIGSYAKADLKKELKSDNIKIVLPSKIYAAVGHEMNLYKDSFILCDNSDRYGFNTSCGSLTTVHSGQNERFTFTPTEPANGVDCTIKVYDKVTLEIITKKTFKLYVKSVTQPTKKVIFIGDSLTDRCIYPAEICQKLGGGNIISLGTRHDTLTYQGSNDVVSVDMDNEGRGGWSAGDYCKLESAYSVTNAFWNPSTQSFDFTYYMEQNGFSSVDCVVIALGTNDIGKPMLNANFDEIISNFHTIVNSIHAYSPSIKVIISLIPHGAEPDGWAASTHSDQSAIYNYLQFTLVEKLISEFEAESNVFLAPTYLNIDHHNDYPTASVAISDRNPEVVKRQINNVHFSVDSTTPVSQCWGYLKMADVIWYTMLAALT